jgi:hypothetical protein
MPPCCPSQPAEVLRASVLSCFADLSCNATPSAMPVDHVRPKFSPRAFATLGYLRRSRGGNTDSLSRRRANLTCTIRLVLTARDTGKGNADNTSVAEKRAQSKQRYPGTAGHLHPSLDTFCVAFRHTRCAVIGTRADSGFIGVDASTEAREILRKGNYIHDYPERSCVRI